MKPESHGKSVQHYFDYLAERFPVMCASDEFHFLPRAESAVRYYDRLDNLDADAMAQVISDLKAFKRHFKDASRCENNLEKKIDFELLGANATGILIAFDRQRIWRHNPLLYLKIAFIGLDHARNKPCSGIEEKTVRVLARLDSVPRLIDQAIKNIDAVPESCHRPALAMLMDCREYLETEICSFLEPRTRLMDAMIQNTISALDALKGFLETNRPVADNGFIGTSIEENLQEHFLYSRDLSEVFRIAQNQWQENLTRLEDLQSRLDPAKSWQEIYHGDTGENAIETDTFTLYREEIDRICRFFDRIGLSRKAFHRSMEIRETPIYLRSVRSAASFGAALTADPEEKSYFFITTHLFDKDSELYLKKRFHREYRFLIAHEAVPGHHLLDSVRRSLKNPVRRQVESPFFYEGWATFAESFLFEYGYIKDTMAHLVHIKRNLWRCARCQIDVGISQGMMKREDAVSLLMTSGFSIQEANRQVDRFRLNPGYQVCYSLGDYEFRNLKDIFGPQFESTVFYNELLTGGELPFDLIRKRLEHALSKTSDGSTSNSR
jgi:hypothetical protein